MLVFMNLPLPPGMWNAVVATGLLLAVFSAPPAHASPAPAYHISIHDLPSPGTADYAVFASWLAAHPRVLPVNFRQMPIQTLYRGNLMMAMAGGTAPDLVRVYHHEAKAWIRHGFLEPLDPYIYRDVDGDDRYTDGVDEVIWEPLLHMPPQVRAFMQEDGHFYIVPRFQWIQFLLYRKDLFREAGLDPEKRIETFDELLHAARKLTDPTASVPGARAPHGRKGIGIAPNGWHFQGWLYAHGGRSMFTKKVCLHCATRNRFEQGEFQWKCRSCEKSLGDIPGVERAALNSPESNQALDLWMDMLWAPFTTCPVCEEPIELGNANTRIDLPAKRDCPHCDEPVHLDRDDQVIYGCARPLIDEDRHWHNLWLDGEIAMMTDLWTYWIGAGHVDPAVVGTMPMPGTGGSASGYHFYGIYRGTKEREGGPDRLQVCVDLILDCSAQYFVPQDHPDYLKYDKERTRALVRNGLFHLCSYDELVAADLEEYAAEIPEGSRRMQQLIRDPDRYTCVPMSEGYTRVQTEILQYNLLSRIPADRDFDVAANLERANTLADTQVFMKEEIVGEMAQRLRWPFFGGLSLFLLALGTFVYRTIRRARVRLRSVRERKITQGKRSAALALLLPAILLVLVWAYYPLVRGSLMAFQEVRLLGGSRFVGVENFIRVVTNPMFMSMVSATVQFVAATLLLGFFAPVILAVLLAEARRFSTLFRIIYYAPHLLGGVVVLFVWRIFYMPTSEGLLNHLIGFLGLGPVRWLEDPLINKWMLVIPGVWATTGAACLIYLAALKTIDDELYEAADMDGAGALRKVMHITLPSLKPLLIINFVGAFIAAFHGMGNVLVLTGGAHETNVIGLQIFLEAFGYLRFGSSTALAWILASVLIGFTVFQLNFLRKVEFRRAA